MVGNRPCGIPVPQPHRLSYTPAPVALTLGPTNEPDFCLGRDVSPIPRPVLLCGKANPIYQRGREQMFYQWA